MRRTVPAHKVVPILAAPEDPGRRVLKAQECFLYPGDGTKPSIDGPSAPEVSLFVVFGAAHQNSHQPAVHEDKTPVLFSGGTATYSNRLPGYVHGRGRMPSLKQRVHSHMIGLPARVLASLGLARRAK